MITGHFWVDSSNLCRTTKQTTAAYLHFVTLPVGDVGKNSENASDNKENIEYGNP